MHDHQYRMATVWQTSAYNQPPHTSYYLPDMVKKLTKPDVYAAGDNEFAVYPDAVLTKMGSGKEKQTVTLGEKIKSFGYYYMFCDSVETEGLPPGLSARVDREELALKISGKPSKAGKFAFTVKTVGHKAAGASAKGEIVVKDTVSESLPLVVFEGEVDYRPATGTFFSPVAGFAEIQFYDVSGTMRASISRDVTAGESRLALERGTLSGGMYVVKVKLDGKTMQRGLFRIRN